MTKLEEEILQAIKDADGEYDFEDEVFGLEAKAAAEVARKYIEKAWKDRIIIFMESENDDGFKSDNARMEAWLKENGII